MRKPTNILIFLVMMLLGGGYIATFGSLSLPMNWMNELAALAPIQFGVLAYLWYRSRSRTTDPEKMDL